MARTNPPIERPHGSADERCVERSCLSFWPRATQISCDHCSAIAIQGDRFHGPTDRNAGRISDHAKMAGEPARRVAALFLPDAERHQGFGHAGGNRSCLRAASRLADGRRDDQSGIPVAQPEQQDPRDPRSERAGRKAAGAVGIGSDPDLSRRQDGQVHLVGPGAALHHDPVADVADGRESGAFPAADGNKSSSGREGFTAALRRTTPSCCKTWVVS